VHHTSLNVNDRMYMKSCADISRILLLIGACGSIVVKALFYKPEGRRFETL
jgi:hypothetical protein